MGKEVGVVRLSWDVNRNKKRKKRNITVHIPTSKFYMFFSYFPVLHFLV
jgi:hypothetical protein